MLILRSRLFTGHFDNVRGRSGPVPAAAARTFPGRSRHRPQRGPVGCLCVGDVYSTDDEHQERREHSQRREQQPSPVLLSDRSNRGAMVRGPTLGYRCERPAKSYEFHISHCTRAVPRGQPAPNARCGPSATTLPTALHSSSQARGVGEQRLNRPPLALARVRRPLPPPPPPLLRLFCGRRFEAP